MTFDLLPALIGLVMVVVSVLAAASWTLTRQRDAVLAQTASLQQSLAILDRINHGTLAETPRRRGPRPRALIGTRQPIPSPYRVRGQM